jgi:hypothetical protein
MKKNDISNKPKKKEYEEIKNKWKMKKKEN